MQGDFGELHLRRSFLEHTELQEAAAQYPSKGVLAFAVYVNIIKNRDNALVGVKRKVIGGYYALAQSIEPVQKTCLGGGTTQMVHLFKGS